MTSPVDKFLGDAISAARDHADEEVNDGASTRLRLRESLANHGASRRKRFTLIAAVIASLFGSTAFAYWAGWRPPWSSSAPVASQDDDAQDKVSMRLSDSARGSAKRGATAIPDAGVEEIASEQLTTPVVVPIETTPAPIETKAAPAETKPVQTKPAVETKSVETKPVQTKPAPVETKAVQTKPAVVETKSVQPKPAPTETKPGEAKPAPPRVTTEAPRVESRSHPSAELASYRNAHNLHFRGNDPKAALAAWDTYLAKYPNGTLVPEARYDRAMVLVKLARWSEARAALAPFANAKAGAYRQNEAAEILAAIRDR